MIKDKNFYKALLRLSLPAAFQSLISLLVVMADNLMVSSIDAQGLAFAAVVQSNSMSNLALALLSGLASGSIVLVSQYWGKKDVKRIQEVGAAVLLLCLQVALVLVVVINLFPRQILGILIKQQETATIEIALEYLPLVSLSFLPLAVSASLVGLLKGIEIVKITVYTTLFSLLTNIGLNYVLIFGKLGLPAMGVRGAALATVIARLLEMLLVIYFTRKKQTVFQLGFSQLRKQAAWAWRDYLRYGLPVGLTDMQWAVIGLLKMVIIGQMGVVMSNAVGVVDSLMNLGLLFTFAMAGGAAVMVGKAVGAGDIPLTKQYAKTIQILFIMVGIVMAAIVYLIRGPFISLYQLTPQASELANQMISLVALTLLGTSYHASCFVGINRGAGDSLFVMIVDMVCGWLIVLPAAALSAFVFKWPLAVVYLMTRIDQTFKWLIAFLRLRGDRWIHQVTRAEPTHEEVQTR